MKKVLLAMLVCVMGICCMSIGASAEDLVIGDGGTAIIYENADYDTVTMSSGILRVYYDVTIDTLVAESGEPYISVRAGATMIINTLIIEDDNVDIALYNQGTVIINTLVVEGENCNIEVLYVDGSMTIDTIIINSGSFVLNEDTVVNDVYLISSSISWGSSYIANIHIMNEKEAVDPTCTDGGNIAYYSCNNCGEIIYIDDDGNYIVGTIDDVTITAIGHSYEYATNNDGTHMITCANDCGYAEEKNCTYDSGVLSTDGTYYTYTCEYCKYCYTEDVEEEEDEEEEEEEEEETVEDEDTDEDTDEEEDSTEDTTEETDSEEATDDTTDDSNTDETDTSEDTTDSTTDDSTNTSDSTTSSSTYTSAYIQYIGGILMSGNTSTSSTVEDVSTGAGMTAESSTTSSALAVVSLLGVAVVMARKRR